MPSGPKKRKAAKKKKGQQGNNDQSNSNSHLGHEDPKSQDERESDGGSSPALKDHHNHQHPFKEGSGEFEKRDPTLTPSFDSENKSMDKVAGELECSQKVGVEDDGADNIERELKSEEDSGSQSIRIKHIEFLKESHDGSSSSSSSDNESQVVEMKAASENGGWNPVNSSLKEVIRGSEKVPLGETDTSLVETAKPLVIESEEVIHVTQGDSVEISVVSDVIESLKENEESKRNEDKVIPLMEENIGASLNMMETVAKENEGKILTTSVTPTETSNDGERFRGSKIPDSSENQPLIASASRVEHRTFWMSCCGLFDVLTSSSR